MSINLKFKAMNFLSISDFKTITGATSITIVSDSKKGTTFAKAGDTAYKVQKDFDSTKPIRFIYKDDEGFDAGCFINVTEDNRFNVVCTL